MATVAAATAAPASSAPLAPTVESATYTVQAGDTVSKIAAQNNTTVDAIVKANNLTNPDKLQVGQKLSLPAGASASAAASAPAVPAASTSASAASKPPPP